MISHTLVISSLELLPSIHVCQIQAHQSLADDMLIKVEVSGMDSRDAMGWPVRQNVT